MYTEMQDVINVVTQNLKKEIKANTLDKNMLSLREQAKSLSLKHGLSEEAMLIEEEEQKLYKLMQLSGGPGGLEYHNERLGSNPPMKH